MPPIPKAKPASAPKGSSFSPGTTERPEPLPRPDSPTGSKASSGAPKTGRKTQRDLLKERLERVYMMIGTILVPFSRFFPALEPIGNNLKEFSTEAANAWMELADEDPKVKGYLESVTGASTWGNVIGIHFAIFATAIPASSPIGSVFGGGKPSNSDDPIAMARKFGLSEEDIAQAVRMGEKMAAGDTIRSDRPPEEATPPNGPVRSGIVDPSQLGVTKPGQEHSNIMPADSGPIKGAA